MSITSSNVPPPLPPVRDGEVRVVLVRHGRTAWNREHRFLGRTDVPLDEVGIAQARQVAAYLGHLPLTAVYASPLRRAADTAAAIAGVHGLPVRVLDDLVELAQGDLEGQPSRVLPQRYPEFLARWLEDPAQARVPGGETLSECQARGLRAIHQVVAAAGAGATVAVVSHQMVIASVLCGLLGRPLREFRALCHDNGALSILDAVGSRVEVRQLQVVPHLRGGR